MALATTYFDCSYSEARHRMCLLGSVDELYPDDAFTLAVMFDDSGWSRVDLKDIKATSVYFGETDSWVTGSDGQIWWGHKGKIQKGYLPDSGSQGRHLGEPTRIRSIAGRLYVCGFAGQVYTQNGKGAWVHMDDGLAEKVGTVGSIALEDIGGTDG